MRISERRVGDVVVLDIAGRLTVTEDPGSIRTVVQNLVGQGHRHLVLNMQSVTYVDSSWLGELVACHLAASRGGSVIKLANPGGRLEHLLALTKLNTVLELYASDEIAVASFAGASV